MLTPFSMMPPTHFVGFVYCSNQEQGEVKISMPLGSKKFAIDFRNAAGSGSLSMRLPPNIKSYLPKDGSKLHASPTKNFTLLYKFACFSLRTQLAALINACEQSRPTDSQKYCASSIVLLPTAQPKSSTLPFLLCLLAYQMQIWAHLRGKFYIPKWSQPQWNLIYISTICLVSQMLSTLLSAASVFTLSKSLMTSSLRGSEFLFQMKIQQYTIYDLRPVMNLLFWSLSQKMFSQKVLMMFLSKRAKNQKRRASLILPGIIMVIKCQ